MVWALEEYPYLQQQLLMLLELLELLQILKF